MDDLFPGPATSPRPRAAELPEIIIDSFAGGGGASTGIEEALGRSPDVAINHDPMAIAMHQANHPETLHLANNIWKVDPADVMPGRRIGLMWASPDCTHHSKAKGGVPIRPANRNSRDLGWVICAWAEKRRPRVIILENVEEWVNWGPLLTDAQGDLRPDPERKGQHFREWVQKLRAVGYQVDWRELRACDFGAPTIRKRLFVIARCDGAPITWPEPTHGRPTDPDVIAGRKRSWRTAAEIIDWSMPCPSIFDTSAEIMRKHGVRAKRPLAPATMARIAKGVRRYVLEAARPFIVPITHAGDVRVNSIDEPLRTQTTAHRGEHAIATPFITKFRKGSTGHRLEEPLHTVTAAHSETHPGGASPLGLVAPVLASVANSKSTGRGPGVWPVEQPLRTETTIPAHAVVAPHLQRQFGASIGSSMTEPVGTLTAGGGGKAAIAAAFLAQHSSDSIGHDARSPVSTIVAGGQYGQSQQAVVAAHMLNLHGQERRDSPADAPAPTATAQGNHAAVVAAFLMAYYGSEKSGDDIAEPLRTETTKDRHGLITVTLDGEPWVIVDIGMRMLSARERFSAQGFPPSYIIDLEYEGRPLTGDAQGRMVGNSVCPPQARALVAANCADLAVAREAAE